MRGGVDKKIIIVYHKDMENTEKYKFVEEVGEDYFLVMGDEVREEYGGDFAFVPIKDVREGSISHVYVGEGIPYNWKQIKFVAIGL